MGITSKLIMKPHDWHYYKDIDAGHLGTYDVWECRVCGAVGHSSRYGPSDPPPAGYAFMPGPAMKLSDDCDVALLQIHSFLQGQKMGHIRWGGPGHHLATFAQCQCVNGQFLEWHDGRVQSVKCPHCAGTGTKLAGCKCVHGARRCIPPVDPCPSFSARHGHRGSPCQYCSHVGNDVVPCTSRYCTFCPRPDQ